LALGRAVVAAEDNWFCRHRGFDWAALQAQFELARAGERPRGASTITQQTAKNVLLWPGRDPVRKVLEAWFAPQLELFWGKRRILEVYLNVAELGPGVFGAEAAARHWFDRPAAELSGHQAATLAAMLPNPRAWTPDDPLVQEKAAVVLSRVGQLGSLLDCVP
jgi:monofunctional biosynthetic peptidoglycan transglycosylase